jgi:hypothetical protein
METQTSTSPRSLGPDDLHSAPVPHMSAWEAFKFGFKGPGPVGLLLGLVMFLIPILGMIVFNGWLAETNRRLVKGEHPSVQPFNFDNLGEYLKSGLVVFIPQIVVGFAFGAVFMVFFFGTSILGAVVAGVAESPALSGIFSLLSMLVMMVASFASTAFIHAIQIRAELTGDLKAAFEFQPILAFVKRNLVPMLVHSLLLGLLLIPAMIAGMLAFVIGMYVVVAAAQFMFAHLRAQLYIQDIAAGGEELPIFDGPGANI